MPKPTVVYACQKCDAQTPKWTGRCFECGGWGTLQETVRVKQNPASASAQAAAKPIDFSSVGEAAPRDRVQTGIAEFDRVVGGGIVPGSLTLLSGEPGIGKSTLVLQIAAGVLAQPNTSVLYVSGEESAEQVRMRLNRLKIVPNRFFFLERASGETIAATAERDKPTLVVVDSVQTTPAEGVSGEAGSVSHVRAVTAILLEAAKREAIPIILIGQVTKGGAVAGPKTLEHMVDTVLSFEGDRFQNVRVLRAGKNRFGGTDEVGIFTMDETGLRELPNPSEAFLRQRRANAPGSCITCALEGTRPILLEIQALVTRSSFRNPQRRAVGIDPVRLSMIAAVLGKRAGLSFENYDIHVNVVGGMRIAEPAADLAIALAIASAFTNRPLSSSAFVCGEIGLGGEIRDVKDLARRMKEAERFGFKNFLVPGKVDTVKDALGFLR